MKYNVLTVAQQEFLGNAAPLIEAATQDILLAPVRCVDCDQYVPFGWVEFGSVRCEKNVGASGVVYGHRMPTEVRTSIIDTTLNALASEVAALRGEA